MRKALIAIAVATALFAIGAFAAAFTTVQSEDVASGTNSVTACAEFADVDFTTSYNAASNDWNVTAATVTFYSDNAGTETSACDGFDATLEVESEAGAEISEGTAEVSGPTASVDLSPDVLVGAVGQASVLVDGQTLIVDPTP
jgi:hypothetical protein